MSPQQVIFLSPGAGPHCHAGHIIEQVDEFSEFHPQAGGGPGAVGVAVSP